MYVFVYCSLQRQRVAARGRAGAVETFLTTFVSGNACKVETCSFSFSFLLLFLLCQNVGKIQLIPIHKHTHIHAHLHNHKKIFQEILQAYSLGAVSFLLALSVFMSFELSSPSSCIHLLSFHFVYICVHSACSFSLKGNGISLPHWLPSHLVAFNHFIHSFSSFVSVHLFSRFIHLLHLIISFIYIIHLTHSCIASCCSFASFSRSFDVGFSFVHFLNLQNVSSIYLPVALLTPPSYSSLIQLSIDMLVSPSRHCVHHITCR